MSSLGTKVVGESKYVPERTITIENGDVIPTDKDVFVKPRAVIKFTNNDAKSYTITFLVHDQDPLDFGALHSDVDLFLPAFGSATTVADPDIKVGLCRYLVVETAPESIGPRDWLRSAEETVVGGAVNAIEETVDAGTPSSTPLTPPRQVVRSASRGGGGGTIHIGG
jgi:hypothetical protein